MELHFTIARAVNMTFAEEDAVRWTFGNAMFARGRNAANVASLCNAIIVE